MVIYSWSEYCVGIIFIVMILLWITREFDDTPGWSVLFPDGYLELYVFRNKDKFLKIFLSYVSDSTVAVFCGVLTLILPNSNPFQSWFEEVILFMICFLYIRKLEI